tara:strand:+ start:799 stop:1068 length:270 start_codon:yes stop_codon:yes gene_type:complete
MIEAIFICTTAIFIYSTINLMRKVEDLEDNLLESDDEISELKIKIRNTISTMKEIDTKGGFESDDEVGAIFDGLKEIVYGLEDDNDKEA